MKVENQTPFAHAWLAPLDKQAAEHLVFVLKATYTIAENGRLEIARKQEPVRAVDEFYGEPGKSSIRYEAELGPAKPVTDVALVGCAVAPQSGTTVMDVSLRVGPLIKRVRVFGERRWKKGLLGLSISKPLPFDRIPLTYENAYGGKDTSAKDSKNHGQEPRNPVGRGFRSKKSSLEFADVLLPNVEEPSDFLRQPGGGVAPAGFGFIGRDWEPRLQYTGTYNEKWMQERMPLLPLDFNERFHNAAHPDLTARDYLKGNEAVEVIGCTRPGRFSFSLPGVKLVARALMARNSVGIPLNLNTVLLDFDAMKVSLLWKGDINIHRQLMQIKQIECRLG
ncbi:MAG TPA: DUF2169 domain-containing protein [Verrucomicrobiae bacterium]|nr:DUF2169 domain-containing protein [Verrucomicrobiae bacterium]